MKEYFRALRDGLVSLKLTVALLVFGIILVFAATIDQTNLGIWGIQQKWFRSFVVMQNLGGVVIPVFPGGYLVGGLLLVNLVAAHLDRFKLTWKKSGIFLTHAGLILLLIGELLSGIWQEDYLLRLNVAETKNYAESVRSNELAIVDTSDASYDDVVTVPEAMLERHAPVQHPKLPFRIATKAYYPNSQLQSHGGENAPTLATAGLGLQVAAAPQPITYRTNEANTPSAYVELSGPEGAIGTFLVSTGFAIPQEFKYANRTWQISLRPRRIYRPFALTLLQFSHDKYEGTEIPKNFASRLRLVDGSEKREVVISMNNPLRYGGLTFYQAGFENNDLTTVLQVVRNPTWQIPYLACALMGVGMLIQFGLHLFVFLSKTRVVAASA